MGSLQFIKDSLKRRKKKTTKKIEVKREPATEEEPAIMFKKEERIKTLKKKKTDKSNKILIDKMAEAKEMAWRAGYTHVVGTVYAPEIKQKPMSEADKKKAGIERRKEFNRLMEEEWDYDSYPGLTKEPNRGVWQRLKDWSQLTGWDN